MKEVITFFGAEPKVGTTMLAQSVAEDLASKKKKCLLICASSNMEDSYLKSETSKASIDNLLNIQPEKLKLSDIQKIILSSGNLDYIRGSARPLQVRYFSENLIPKIVELVDYDYIIIDGGSNYHFPLPISSLLAATKIFYVLLQRSRAINRFALTQNLILNSPALKTDAKKAIVVNKYEKKGSLFPDETFTDRFKLPMYTVNKVAGSTSCEINNTTLYKTNKNYKTNISSLVNVITGGDNNA